jgi:hypothetical protein
MGVLVVLPNFGDEKGIAEILKLAALNVPVFFSRSVRKKNCKYWYA